MPLDVKKLRKQLTAMPMEEDESIVQYTRRIGEFYATAQITLDAEDEKNIKTYAQYPAASSSSSSSSKEEKKSSSAADKARAAIEEERIKTMSGKVNFALSFDTHIFEGEIQGISHVGLHSLHIAKTKGHQITRHTADLTTGAFGATILLYNEKSKKHLTQTKYSSFFPDKMTPADVRKAVAEAYNYSLVHKDFGRIMEGSAGLHWVGVADVGGKPLVIGGLGHGNKSGGIMSAFPAINQAFSDRPPASSSSS